MDIHTDYLLEVFATVLRILALLAMLSHIVTGASVRIGATRSAPATLSFWASCEPDGTYDLPALGEFQQVQREDCMWPSMMLE
jgi:hypothetical protein